MTWFALAQLIFQLFGPAIAAWLKSLLERDGPPLDPKPPFGPATAVTTWFDNARARLRWWEVGKRSRLALLERIATKHATAMDGTRRGRAAPVLDKDDEAELAKAL